jgi:hypothetical protein
MSEISWELIDDNAFVYLVADFGNLDSRQFSIKETGQMEASICSRLGR